MSIIEGVGDEVFQVLIVALVVFLGIVGWWSTSISEQPLIRTVLILEPRHHTPSDNTTAPTVPSVPQDTGQPDPTPPSEVQTETTAVPNTSSGASKNEGQAGQSEGQGEGHSAPELQPQASGRADPGSSSSQGLGPGPESGESSTGAVGPNSTADVTAAEAASGADTSNELRRRRLQFFGDRQGTDNAVNQPNNSVDTSPEGTEATNAGHEAPGQPGQPHQQEPQGESGPSSSDPCPACDDIRIKLKFLNDNQKLVQGKLQECLGDFKRRNFAVEIAAQKVIRLIFNGQVLQSDERTLHNYGLFDNCVVHCLVRNQSTTNSNVENATASNNGEDLHFGGADGGDTREWDMSNVMYISMFVILSAIWYLRINFSQLFSATSTVALFGLSGIFVIFLVGTYIPDQEVIRT